MQRDNSNILSGNCFQQGVGQGQMHGREGSSRELVSTVLTRGRGRGRGKQKADGTRGGSGIGKKQTRTARGRGRGGRGRGGRNVQESAVPNEHDIELTDNEDDGEEDPLEQEDIDFLDDRDHGIDGLEQARMVNEQLQNQNHNPVQQLQEALQGIRGRKRKAASKDFDDDDEKEKKQKKRSDKRQLQVTLERGIGESKRSVSQYHNRAPFHLKVADLVTPWQLQHNRRLFDFGLDMGKLEKGAFGDEDHRRWVHDPDEQSKFARLFYVPMTERIPLRKLSTDVPDTTVDINFPRTNSTTKVLHAFRLMHPKTELDHMEDKFYEKVLLGCQRTTRELRQNIDAGPFGGLQGKAVDVLWKVYSGEEVSNLDTSTLQLVQAISMALQGSRGDELWPMVRTQYTDPYVRGKTGMSKVQSGVQTLREYNFHNSAQHSGRCAIDDVDKRLVKKVWKYRFGEAEVPFHDTQDLSKLVHKRFQKSNQELSGTEIKIEPQKPSTDPVIVDIWVYKDIFHVWDQKNKMQTNVTVEGIYICAKAPACDPLVILRSIAENNPTASTLLSGYFGHMMQVLGLESCPWDQLFNTDRAGATDVVSEAAMLQGLFMFCESQGFCNLNVGGFRMDVCNHSEMNLWERYMRTLRNARRKHYEITTREVLHDRSSMKDAQLPVEDWMLDFLHGVTYWKTKLSDVLQEKKEYEDMYEEEEDIEHVKKELTEWLRGHHFEDDPSSFSTEFMFLEEGVGFAMNTGIWIKIRTDNKESYEEEKTNDRGKRGKSDDLCMLPQPQQQNPMVRLWCGNMCEIHDPLDEVFCHSALVPDMKWMTEELPKLDRAVGSMQVLKETIGDLLVVKHSKILSGVNARLREIMLLTGKERNQMRDKISMMDDNMHIKFLYKSKINKISTAIKQTLQIMSSCELAMWRTAALGIRDLKRQSSSAADKWKDDYLHVNKMSISMYNGGWQDFLCSSTLPSLFYVHSLSRIDSDLSYMNTFLQIVMRNSFMAFGMNTPGAYGMTLRIGDMGISTKILTEGEGKNGSKGTSTMLFDTKFPGMGIDQCTGNLLQQCNAAMIHISLTKEHRDMAVLAVDTSMKTVSKFSYSTLQGSAVLVNSSGEILPMNNDFQKRCGNLCFFSEWGKDSMDISTMGCIESNLANSGDQEHGAESGVQQSSWQTTQFLESCGDVKIRKLPILYITGNKPSNATPASAIEGGRWVNIASSTQDNDNGFYLTSGGSSMKVLKPNIPRQLREPWTDNNEIDEDADSLSAQAMMTNAVSTKDVRRDIKTIKREVVLRNRLYFLMMQWMKRDAVLLLSAMTSDPKTFFYTMRCNFSNIEAAVGMLTLGLRREYLQKLDGKFWHRNAVGPWSKVSQISTHVHLTMTNSLLSAMDEVLYGWPLDLHMAFELGIRAVLTQTISFSAMLNSLHIWLSSSVLDINVMILSSFIYHFTGFQHTCSLRILSLAIIGELEVTDEEDWKAYMAFCEFMCPCLLEQQVLKPAVPRGTNMRKGPRNVRKGVLKTPLHEMLATWTSATSTQAAQADIAAQRTIVIQQDMETAYQARMHGPEQEAFSVYCQPRLSFVHTDGIKGFSRSKDGQHFLADENISGTSARVLGTMLAREQKLHAHRLRIDRSVFMYEHENTADFWKNVQTGTAMPQSNSSTNDICKLKFEEPQFTGLWWEETMTNAGLCEGVLKLFLLQSKLNPNTITEHQFWTKLLAPYLKHISSSSRVYGGPRSPGFHKDAWNSLVLAKKNMFEFSSIPFKKEQGDFQGVSVNLCMRLTHYMIMQGLGVTKDWNNTVHESSDYVSCVHLRNMSHMSLGLLSMFLHTCCDKTLIPSNKGTIVMSAPSPLFKSKDAAQVEYDARLHTDTHQHAMGGRSDNVLTVASRMAHNANWEMLEFANGQCALWYTPVLRDCVQMNQANSRANLFPFPPEAVAHTAFMFDDMFLANRRCMEVFEKQWASVDMDQEEPRFQKHENVFAIAMLLMGNSMNSELCAHIQPSLTDCAIRNKREIPCVTLEHGFLFTISFQDGLLYLRPTARTHAWTDSQTLELRDNLPFTSLPLANDEYEVVLPSMQFSMLFHHGLQCDKIDSRVLQVEVNVECTDRKKLPFYLFPVVHFPVLIRLEHSGWYVKTKNPPLLLHNNEYFFWKHQTIYKFCNSNDSWLLEKCPDVCQLLKECRTALPSVKIEAYFFRDNSTEVLGFWATENDLQMHFSSIDQVREQLAKDKFLDTEGLCPTTSFHESNPEDSPAQITCYLMLECSQCGLAPVYREADGEKFLTRFFFVDKEDPTKEHITEFTKNDQNITARMLALGEESARMSTLTTKCQEIWGLVIENSSGHFLSDGCYQISSLTGLPFGNEHTNVSFEMDFINMSRCMLAEGSELWITVTQDLYRVIIRQIKEQGLDVMLPLSKELHENMHAKRLVRAFYVLGGSVHDQDIEKNTIRLMCIIASKKSVPGNKATHDDNAGMDSVVNQQINQHDTRMVSISLPILNRDKTPIISCERDKNLPFYKFFKEGPPQLDKLA